MADATSAALGLTERLGIVIAEEFPKLTHCVDLTESTIEATSHFFASKEEVPAKAYTMGIQTIMNAKKILVVVSGSDKAQIVKKALI